MPGPRWPLARAGRVLAALWLGAALLPAADPSPSPSTPPLESVAAIRRLTPEQFHREIPVRVRGTLTFTGGPRDGYVDGFLHDGTQGLYFTGPVAAVPDFRVGDVLEVEGTAIPGGFAPMVWLRQSRILGRQALPEPRRVSARNLLNHPDDSNWVEISGSVEFTSDGGNGWTDLALESEGTLLVARVPDAGLQTLGTNAVGSQLRLRGVATGIFSGQRRLVALRLLVPNPTCVDVVIPTPKVPADEPVVPIGSLFAFVPQPLYRDRAHVEGVVTAIRNQSEYFLQDETGGLLVRDLLNPSRTVGQVQLGMRLGLSGRLEMAGLQPVMVLPRMIHHRAAALPPARPAIADELRSGVVSGLRVELEAAVHHKQDSLPDDPGMLSCTVSNVPVRIFTSAALGRLPPLPSGTRVRVRGTCLHVSGSSVFRTTPSLELHLARREDLEVLSRPFVWTARRVGAFALGLGLAGLGAAGWGVTLRRQVRHRTLELEKINDLLKTEANSQQMDLAA
ncbi:MAG: hypothetical protein ACKO3N_12740 [Verrucomicrobiota bacterium]